MRILIFVIVMFFASCGKPLPTSTVATEVIRTDEGILGWVWIMDYETAGMHYKVFSISKGGLVVINVTKDSLEVANMKSYNSEP